MMHKAIDNPWRADFPILGTEVKGKPLVYLDNAATTQKPRVVIERMSEFLARENANIHRGVYYLSLHATDEYDRAREIVARFLNAREPREIIFVRGATEAINLVARSFGSAALSAGDEIILTVMEHHSNIVPWQLIAEEKGAVLKVIPITDDGELRLDEYEKLFNDRTRVAAFTHVSNALGTVNPVKEMTRLARERGVAVVMDGAQAVPHLPVDVQEIGCDFYAFSGHKLFGPYGVGVLYGRAELLDSMAPYQGGGDMIEQVTFEKTTYRRSPERFEAGTPNISGAIGLAAAIDYVNGISWEAIGAHELSLMEYATAKLREIPGVNIVGNARQKTGVISFVMDGVHPHDLGTVLDAEGVAIRAGHHCTQPLMRRLGIAATARVSLSFYNTAADVDCLADALRNAGTLFNVGG